MLKETISNALNIAVILFIVNIIIDLLMYKIKAPMDRKKRWLTEDGSFFKYVVLTPVYFSLCYGITEIIQKENITVVTVIMCGAFIGAFCAKILLWTLRNKVYGKYN